MPLADTATLFEGNQFFTQLHDEDADRKSLATLVDWCSEFSPLVAVKEPDSLYLDLDGVTHLYGDEPTLIDHLIQAFRSKGYRPQLAIADTPSAAWSAAHFVDVPSTIVESPELLFELPVAALRLPDVTLEKLDRLGIHRIGQLAELPRKSLPSRIGQEVIDRLDCLTGDKSETLCVHRSPPVFEQQWLLDQATGHWETIKHIVHVLLERLASQLRQHGCGANRLSICFDCKDTRPTQIEIGLYRPSADARHFDSLAQTQLETNKFSSAVQCVTVVADQTEALEQLQDSLLADHRTNPRELAELVERLSSRLGENRVVRALPVDDWQPEKAFRYHSCSRIRQNLDELSTKPPNSGEFGYRPLRMFFPPQPINVTAIIPDGPPARFHYRGEQHIANFWGPQRLETAWWRGACVRRDYYRVETESAHRFWLFRRLDDGQWFLHGSFD